MAIAFDNNQVAVIQGSGTTQTQAYTCSGSDRILFVYILKQQNRTCTGVTYGGVAMTQVRTIYNPSAGGGENLYLFMLVNPASGSNNIVASFSASSGASGITAVSYTGAAQTGQPDASITNSATATGLTTSLTTVADNSWLVGAFRTNGTMAAGANTTLRGTLSNIMIGDTNAAQTPAGSKSMAHTQPISSFNYHLFASIAPAGGAPSPQPSRLMSFF